MTQATQGPEALHPGPSPKEGEPHVQTAVERALEVASNMKSGDVVPITFNAPGVGAGFQVYLEPEDITELCQRQQISSSVINWFYRYHISSIVFITLVN